MKVKVKRGEGQSIIPILIAFIFFGTFGLSVLITSFVEIMTGDFKNFLDVFSNSGVLILFAIVFTILFLYIIYVFLKKPRKYVATLTEKVTDTYKGKQIVCMTFKIKKRAKNLLYQKYHCYTLEDNDLTVGKEYIIKIKELTYKIREVDEVKDFTEESLEKTNQYKIKGDIGILITIIAICFIFGTGTLFLVVKMIYEINNHISDYFLNVIPMIFCVGMCIGAYSIYKKTYIHNSTNDNILEEENSDSEILKNEQVLYSTNRKVPDMAMKYLKISFYLKISLIWILVLMGALYNAFIKKTSFIQELTNPEYLRFEVFLAFLIMSVIFAIVGILQMIPYMHYDDKMIKKYKLKILPNNPIKDIYHYKIFIPSKNDKWKDLTFEKYFVIDNENNLLYKVQKVGRRHQYIISDQLNNEIGEIKRKGYMQYVIRLIDKEPFAISLQFKMEYSNYEGIGIDYEINGSKNGLENTICKKNGQEIAKMLSKSMLGKTEITINTQNGDNENIVMTALAVRIANTDFWNRRNN